MAPAIVTRTVLATLDISMVRAIQKAGSPPIPIAGKDMATWVPAARRWLYGVRTLGKLLS
jgi:hypothetical protein